MLLHIKIISPSLKWKPIGCPINLTNEEYNKGYEDVIVNSLVFSILTKLQEKETGKKLATRILTKDIDAEIRTDNLNLIYGKTNDMYGQTFTYDILTDKLNMDF